MKTDGKWVDNVAITGQPYQQGNFWYVPSEISMQNGKTEVATPMIKFYQFDESTHCFIIGSKEKGIVD